MDDRWGFEEDSAFDEGELPDDMSLEEQFPIVAAFIKALNPFSERVERKQARQLLEQVYIKQPLNPQAQSNWQRAKEQGERRFLGYSTRPAFELMVRDLPFQSKGWKILSPERVYGKHPGGKAHGFYVRDPWDDVWALAMTSRGGVHLENLTHEIKGIFPPTPFIEKGIPKGRPVPKWKFIY